MQNTDSQSHPECAVLDVIATYKDKNECPECEEGQIEYEDGCSADREEPKMKRRKCELCGGSGKVGRLIAIAWDLLHKN